MGYVPMSSELNRLKSAITKEEKHEAATCIIQGYNRYRAGMRSGLFGAVFGWAIFPASGDMPLPRKESFTNAGKK